ncbi:Maf family protein [Wielerella bovis]|uniref:Maf family protein n=1 Tax=Wielerella bovis TaxID=2917790 RepID=UPI00201952E0|nr:nucleoside triphosphate pyrophosphatase [Wielerella bovis]ULJ60167.1 Maf family nucleotide pyrophosphatase [Wielerella bovis]
MTATHEILLASASPRRRDILHNLGYTVHTVSADIDETPRTNETPHDYVLRLATEKNRAVRAKHFADNLPIVSADTSVVQHGKILGKPESKIHAAQMLTALSGCTHQVLTAVCVSFGEHEYALVQQNDVQFKILSLEEISAYIATGEPMDKAGAYGIQGIGGVFVAHLSGSFTGVMGLPVFETVTLLRRCGANVPPFQAA